MAVIQIREEDFDRFVLKNKKTVLVEFYDHENMMCRALNPILAELAEDLAGLLVIAKLTSDNLEDFGRQYGLESIPTMMVFCDGEKIDSMMGLRNKQQIFEMIKKHL